VDFEWDDAKSEKNLIERGFGFDFAALIFEVPVLERVDTRRDYGEARVQAICEADGYILFVVYLIEAKPAALSQRAWQTQRSARHGYRSQVPGRDPR
jgi:uncharacterized DUF497 family protein